jgi:hypothetical protein
MPGSYKCISKSTNVLTSHIFWRLPTAHVPLGTVWGNGMPSERNRRGPSSKHPHVSLSEETDLPISVRTQWDWIHSVPRSAVGLSLNLHSFADHDQTQPLQGSSAEAHL